jgi:hypothetical protein
MDLSNLLSLAGSFPSLAVALGGLALIGLLFFGALESVRDRERTPDQKDQDIFFFACIAAFMVLGLMMLTIIVNK